jgi:nitrate/nitrite transporter NarK
MKDRACVLRLTRRPYFDRLRFQMGVTVWLRVRAVAQRKLKNVGPIYGLMLTAWGFASAFGPLLIAYMQQISGTYRGALHVIAGVMAASMILPVIVSPPRRAEDRARAQAPQRSRLPAA